MACNLLDPGGYDGKGKPMISVIRSGMNAALKDLDVTSNNIANARTTGFKRREASFADLYNATVQSDPGAMIGSGARNAEIRVMRGQGTLTQTGAVLDLAVEGQGMFTLRDTNNPVTPFYTRDGAFSVDLNGEIVNKDGYQVLSSTGNPIRVPPRADGILTADGLQNFEAATLTGVSIRSDGTVEATYGADRVFAVGKVGLATFAAADRLTPIGANLFRENSRSGAGVLGEAVDGGRGKIHSGALEMSNIDMTLELTNMIKAQQAFSGSSRLLQSESDMVRKFV